MWRASCRPIGTNPSSFQRLCTRCCTWPSANIPDFLEYRGGQTLPSWRRPCAIHPCLSMVSTGLTNGTRRHEPPGLAAFLVSTPVAPGGRMISPLAARDPDSLLLP